MFGCGDDLIDATFALGSRSRLCRGAFRVWWLDRDRRNDHDFDCWRGCGHEYNDHSGFDVDGVDCYGDVDSG